MYVWMHLQSEHKLQETVQGEKKKHNKCAFIEIKKLPHVNSKLWFVFFFGFYDNVIIFYTMVIVLLYLLHF